MRRSIIVILSCLMGLIVSSGFNGWAGAQTGKKAADSYFLKRKKPSKLRSAVDHYLSLHVGTFVNDKAYRWGSTRENLAHLTAGVSYRMGEWVGSMDLLLRADFITFDLVEKNVTKMSLMPIVTFPEANSQFPLYFGGGLGLGVFFNQIDGESPISLDYQLLMGVRLFELTGSTGFTFEWGMKNHIHLLSNGQHSGVFASLGMLSTF